MLNDDKNENEEGLMNKRPPIKYYPTLKAAEEERKIGQRIYREAGKGYYIWQPRPPRKKSFLEKFFG